MNWFSPAIAGSIALVASLVLITSCGEVKGANSPQESPKPAVNERDRSSIDHDSTGKQSNSATRNSTTTTGTQIGASASIKDVDRTPSKVSDAAGRDSAGRKDTTTDSTKVMDSTKTTDAPMTSDGSNTTDVSRTTEVRRSTQDDKSTSAVDGRATETQPAKVDNSGRNEVDKDGHTMTPFDQGSSDGDMAITQNIRKMLVADGSLSINAQNLKVITNNGIVVLRGPVASQMESDVILAHVNKVIGITKVENQINVP